MKKKWLGRFHQDGKSLVLPMDLDIRDILMRADPDVFYITDHYRDYPAVLVRLAKIKRVALSELLDEVWRRKSAE